MEEFCWQIFGERKTYVLAVWAGPGSPPWRCWTNILPSQVAQNMEDPSWVSNTFTSNFQSTFGTAYATAAPTGFDSNV